VPTTAIIAKAAIVDFLIMTFFPTSAAKQAPLLVFPAGQEIDVIVREDLLDVLDQYVR
jgi:hypothetical protein